MATYKPSTTATYGTSGQSVKDLQTKLNTQNTGQAGYTPLKVDGMYGPLTQAASNFKAPTTPTTTTTPPPGSAAYTYQKSAADIAYDNQRDAIGSYYKEQFNSETDPNKTYQNTLKGYQGQIDSINNMFNDQLNNSRITNAPAYKARENQNRIGQVMGGLVSSPMGQSQTNQIQDANAQEQASAEAIINDRRAGAIASLFGQVRASSEKELESKRLARSKGADALLEHLNGAQARKQKTVSTVAKSLIAQGIDINSMSPEELNKLIGDIGTDKDTLVSGYQTAMVEEETRQQKIKKDEADTLKNSQFVLSEGQARYDQEGNVIASKSKTFAPKTGGGGGGTRGMGGGNGGGTSKNGGKFTSDLDMIYGSLRTGKNSRTVELLDSAYLKSRDDNDRISILAQNVSLPADVKSDVIKRTTAFPMLDSAIALLDSGVQTGYFKGLIEKGANKFGQTTDPQINKIQQYIISATQPYRNSVTGAAWGTQEDAEYKALFGSTLDNPEFLRGKLQNLKDMMQQSNISTIASGLSLLDPSKASQYMGGSNSSPSQTTQPLSMTDEELDAAIRAAQ